MIPFFTTKDTGEGTGLGLSMVYGFISKSEGHITVTSTREKGACFDIFLPKTIVQDTKLDKPNYQKTTQNKGNETILVVEDEDEIRAVIIIMLSKAGYRVLEAENGIEALKIVQQYEGVIDLIFTDISMPGGMNGVQMAARAQSIRPNVKLIFTTGYKSEAIPDIQIVENYKLINKPYQTDIVLENIRSIIDEN